MPLIPQRALFNALLAVATAAALVLAAGPARAQDDGDDFDDLTFPGEDPDHRIVYQLNKADPNYQEHIFNSIRAMLQRYGDRVHIVVVAFGPGIHILAKRPLRPVPPEFQQRVSSFDAYGVEFHACRNTMDALGWQDEDMVDFAEVVDVGAADLMELQENGYAYIAW